MDKIEAKPGAIKTRTDLEALNDERAKARYAHKTSVLVRHREERDALERTQQIEREALRTKHYRELGVFE